MLIATSGHIDHGKTSLVRALTGVETDRLPAEKERGITIDLGFAYWPQDGAATIGFVDVPGHERFVRNMLAGAAPVDFALLVVAADDGVMPQTVEHAEILDLLGIARGAVAITKIDLVDDARIASVASDVTRLLSRTSLRDAPHYPVSTATGDGLADLAEALRRANRATPPRQIEMRNFRMAVDRAFSIKGSGTVVTGAALDGVLTVGDRLVLSPRGTELRVRGLQSAGKAVDRVAAGQRCAINLSGIERSELHRGDWLVVQPMHAPTQRLTVRLRVLAGADTLNHNTHVHLHHGTADLTARVLIPGRSRIGPGEEGLADLVLDHPTGAATGDRFVLRDQSGQHTIGGGIVLDPFAPQRRRRENRDAVIAALGQRDPADALAELLALPGQELDTRAFERRFNLKPEVAEHLYRGANAVLYGKGGTRALPARRLAQAANDLRDRLQDFHAAVPEAEGMTLADCSASLADPISRQAVQVVLRSLASRGVIEQAGGLVRLAGHKARTDDTATRGWHEILKAAEGLSQPSFGLGDLAKATGQSEKAVAERIAAQRGSGDIWRISDSRYLLREHLFTLATKGLALSGTKTDGFSVAEFRDHTGIGRNLAIPLLEFFDRIGLSQRKGELRRIRPEYMDVLRRAADLERSLPARDYMPKKKPRRR